MIITIDQSFLVAIFYDDTTRQATNRTQPAGV